MNPPTVEQTFQQITDSIPNIRWIRIVSIDGLTHPKYRFDAGNVPRNTPTDIEEDRYAPLTAASISLSERICYEMVLGAPRFTVIAGTTNTHLVFPIGDGQHWIISFGIKGQPAIDPILQYFREQDYLAHLVPLLNI